MNKMVKFFGLAAIIAAIAFSMASCDSGTANPAGASGGGSGASVGAGEAVYSGKHSSNNLTLTITEKKPGTAAYKPKTGDNYKMLVGNKVSSGTVLEVETTETTIKFTLKSSNGGVIFNVTINLSSNRIANVTGTVTFDNEGDAPWTGPGNVNNGSSGSGGGGGGGSSSGGSSSGGSGGGSGGGGGNASSGWIEVKNNPFNVIFNTELGETSFGNTIRSIAYGNSRFVATGYCFNDDLHDGEKYYNQIGYSSDGITWNIVADNPFPNFFPKDGLSDSVNVITFGNGIFVAGGSYTYRTSSVAKDNQAKIAYSYDGGITWSIANQINDLKGYEWSGIENIVFGNGKFIATDGYGMAYSYDGANWTVVDTPRLFGSYYNGRISDYGSIDIIAFGNGNFVAIGSSNEIGNNTATSTDGVTWTVGKTALPYSFSLNRRTKIAYGNGRFVAIDTDGYLANSPDGITWNRLFLTNGTTAAEVWGPFYELGYDWDSAIAFGNDRFVASHIHGVAYSSDGITWSALETPIKDNLFGSISIKTIAYSDNGRFFAGGNSGIMVYRTFN